MGESSVIDTLRRFAKEAALRAYVPYSGQPRAALVLLSDGDWICGVRIENASYPLVIPALHSALVRAVITGREDIAAVILSAPAKAEESFTILQSVTPPIEQLEEDFFGTPGFTYRIRTQLTMRRHVTEPINPYTGIHLARRAAAYARAPESDFPVGAIAVTDSTQYFQGANIEHPDWTRILCAERTAIAAAVSAGVSNIESIYVSCLKSAAATPCGACRQVLYEIAPKSVIWMDRGSQAPECFRTEDLLPRAFSLTNRSRTSSRCTIEN